MEEALKKASEKYFFSNFEIKSTYHQVPMNEEDKKFTVFEIGGKLYDCNRLFLGVTNTVPAFHTIIDIFVNRNKLEMT